MIFHATATPRRARSVSLPAGKITASPGVSVREKITRANRATHIIHKAFIIS
jgi:hypothetical protein